MIRSTLMVLTVSSVLSISSMAAFAQSSGNDAPVDKGGMPPSTEMNAGSGDGKALPPGSIGGGNAGDASGSSTSPGAGSEVRWGVVLGVGLEDPVALVVQG